MLVTTPIVDVAPGQDFSDCFSMTLDNDDPLWVNAVIMDAGPAWHHANWLYVPEWMYPGEDGIWDCSSRNFDEIDAGIIGGVLFAQSTQVSHEEQHFPAGAAFEVPARSKVVSTIHLVNAGDAPVATQLTLDVRTTGTPKTKLQPMSLAFYPLDLPPQTRSRVVGNCDYGEALGAKIYYALPHYHSYGRGFEFDGIGGPGDTKIYSTSATQGHVLGGTLDPPVDVTENTGFRFSCEFENTTDAPLDWSSAGEMCLFLAYTDSPKKWVGGVVDTAGIMGLDPDGVTHIEGPCVLYGL